MNFLVKIKYFLPKSEIKRAYFLLLGVIVSGFVEAFGIGIILPFISVVSDFTILEKYPGIINLFGKVGVTDVHNIIVILAATILFFICIKNLYLFLFMRYQQRFIQQNTANFSIKLLKKYLNADYLYHLQTNSSDLIRDMKSTSSKIFNGVITSTITIASESLLMLIVVCLLIIVEPIAALVGIFILCTVGVAFYKTVKKKSAHYGTLMIKHEGETFKWINQSLGGIKEVKLLGRKEYFQNKCETHYNKLANIMVYQFLVSLAPRLFLETLMVVTIMTIVIVLLLQGSSSGHILPTLALFCAAAFRLMPATNRILGAAINLKFSIPAVDVIYKNLIELETKYNSDQDINNEEEITFNDSIYFENVSFRYPVAEGNALENITVNIPKNKSVGIIGVSGAGKSTLLNILLGLLRPTKGQILIDKKDMQTNIRGWQKMIGFVPQEIYLTDDSIKRNIAYGLNDSDINESLVWKALQLAQLDTFVKDLPEGLDAFVGERGVRVSGGQRQRIGIARALYHNPDVLIFDEATSSVDITTEKEITKSIESLGHIKTIIIVAHRLSTIENCDIIYNLDSGTIELRRDWVTNNKI